MKNGLVLKLHTWCGERWLQDDIVCLPCTSTARCRQCTVCWVILQCRRGRCLTFRLTYWYNPPTYTEFSHATFW